MYDVNPLVAFFEENFLTFIEDNENIYDTIREIASNQPTMVVFDDLINSKTIQTIAKLYTVDGRHMNLSMVFLQGVPKKMRHLFSLISPCVLMLQDYALYGQLEDVLPFVLHIGSGLSDKRFSRYSVYGFDYQIL